jgi:hypothetical protein
MHMVTMSDADFDHLYETLRRACTATDNSGVLEIIAMEREAWEILQKVAEAQGLQSPVER